MPAPRSGEPWLVQDRKASRMDNDRRVVLRQQDNYPSRRVVQLEPFMPDDPSRIQAQDIVRLRQVLPTPRRVGSRLRDAELPAQAKKKHDEPLTMKSK